LSIIIVVEVESKRNIVMMTIVSLTESAVMITMMMSIV
jgi:hypothetical protein